MTCQVSCDTVHRIEGLNSWPYGHKKNHQRYEGKVTVVLPSYHSLAKTVLIFPCKKRTKRAMETMHQALSIISPNAMVFLTKLPNNCPDGIRYIFLVYQNLNRIFNKGCKHINKKGDNRFKVTKKKGYCGINICSSYLKSFINVVGLLSLFTGKIKYRLI